MTVKSKMGIIKSNRKSTSNPQCGICGKTKNLTKIPCCDNWICDDVSRAGCYRNHDRYTLCASHYHERHAGNWKSCDKCKNAFETEMYVYFGTNKYNFEKLANPPSFEPTTCSKCGKVIVLSKEVYSTLKDDYFCAKCTKEDY